MTGGLDVLWRKNVGKFGKAFDIDTADNFAVIWDGTGNSSSDNPTYTYSTSADIDSLSSSSGSDTVAVTVIGLDSTYAQVTQTITLTGQTRVALTTSLIRVFRAYVDDAAVAAVGNIFCFVNGATTSGVPDTGADIRAIISIGYEQTLMAVYTIPLGKVGYLESFYANILSKVSAGSEVQLCVRATGKTFRVRSVIGANTAGSSHVRHHFGFPIELAAKTDIHVQADTSANNASVAGGFDIILEDA